MSAATLPDTEFSVETLAQDARDRLAELQPRRDELDAEIRKLQAFLAALEGSESPSPRRRGRTGVRAEDAVVSLLRDGKAWKPKALAEASGFTPATIYRAVRLLSEDGRVSKTKDGYRLASPSA